MPNGLSSAHSGSIDVCFFSGNSLKIFEDFLFHFSREGPVEISPLSGSPGPMSFPLVTLHLTAGELNKMLSIFDQSEV